jgi:hypothetical protein
MVILRRVYDENNLLLEEKNNYGATVYYSESDIFANINFLTQKEEESARIEMHKDYHVYQVTFQVEELDGEKV